MDMKPEHPTYPNATSLLNAWQRTIAFILGPEEYQAYKDRLLENIYPENKKTIMPSLPMVHYVLRESHTAWFHYYHNRFADVLNFIANSTRDGIPYLIDPPLIPTEHKVRIEEFVAKFLGNLSPGDEFQVLVMAASEYRREVVRRQEMKHEGDLAGQLEGMTIGDGGSEEGENELVELFTRSTME